MTRLRFSGVVSALTVLTVGSVAYAQSQAQIASQLNEEGKELVFAGKFSESSAKFREAVARVPEPKYFYNLCSSLLAEGKFDESLTACNAVGNNNPDNILKDKTAKLIDKITATAKTQNIELHPGGGGGGGDPQPTTGDPNTGNPNTGNPETGNPNTGNPNTGNPETGNPNTGNPNTGNPNTGNPNTGNPNTGNPNGFQNAGYRPAVGRPPADLFTAVTPDNNYTWTLGIDVYGGGGGIGTGFGSTAGGFRVKGDYLINRPARIGAEAYIQYTTVGDGSDTSGTGSRSLEIVDVGLALYKHLCPAAQPRLCLTPLVGAQVSVMNPNGTDADGMSTFEYAAAGFRGEVAATYAFGPRFQHAISLSLGVNAYTKVLSDPTDGSPSSAQVGLDSGGAFVYVGLGYTYRFNTPLGSTPFVILE